MTLPKNDVKSIKTIIELLPGIKAESLKNIFSQDALDVIRKSNLAPIKNNKSFKELFYNFFGMNHNWSWKRNVGGFVMVHCPEYPTYFIPTYSQTSSTGNPGHVKKTEIPRGIITGGLEGIAVGALVSGEFLKPKEMVPYVFLGAALQLFSCTFFPWLGEAVGKQVYKSRVAAGKIIPGISFSQDFSEPVIKKKSNKKQKPTFSAIRPYGNLYSSNIFKI